MPELDVVIGLGANLGDRHATIVRAIDAIASLPRTTLLARAPIYETAPIGPPQPSYLNTAARVSTALSAHELLSALLDIERSFGRVRRERWGPRTLDLDLLWSPTCDVNDASLTLPHPRLLERAFALAPLLDVAPELVGTLGARLAALGGPPPRAELGAARATMAR